MAWRKRDFDPYYERIRQEVLKRDKYKCVLCSSKKKIQVHHIITHASAPLMRSNPLNLCVLCEKCHKKVTKNEHYYASLLSEIVLRKYQK